MKLCALGDCREQWCITDQNEPYNNKNLLEAHFRELFAQFQGWLRHPHLTALPLEDVIFHPKSDRPVNMVSNS